MTVAETTKPQRIELILRQIDALPTLPSVATRLLQLTASDESNARQVIDLIAADPAMTAKVLALCGKADKGVDSHALTIDKAVVLLGFNAIRNAVLSLKVFELFDRPQASPQEQTEDDLLDARFDRPAYWMHCLAVAVIAERLANAHPDPEVRADEAFVCGLLHDIGKLALDYVLPKSFGRVVELTQNNQGNIAELERKILGIDHHTAGKRLAEQWGLPHRLQDAIWLHGTPFDALPKLEHKHLVGLIGLADLLARQQHLGYSGNFRYHSDPSELAQKLGLDARAVESATDNLYDDVHARAAGLGLDDTPSRELYMQSVQRANEALGKLNAQLEKRGRQSAMQQRVLETVAHFHQQAGQAQNVNDVLHAVALSARSLFGPGFWAAVFPGAPKGFEDDHHDDWLFTQFSPEAEPVQSVYVEKPPYAPDLSMIDPTQTMGLNLMGILPWLSDYLMQAEDLRSVQILPLPCSWGTAALLLHDQKQLLPQTLTACLAGAWGGAIASAARHDGARRMGEELAQANAALAEAQDRLLQQASLARLGQMAAGAAHEMNNPLAVISGRSQLLSMSLTPGTKEQKTALTIFKESHRLSDLITALHLFADPPKPQKKPIDLEALVDETVKQVRNESAQTKRHEEVQIGFSVKGPIPQVRADADHLRRALKELLLNAVQANPQETVQVSVSEAMSAEDPGRRVVRISVTDDGDGMTPEVLEHAMDPFFSAKAAGRRVGMGLPRANQLISAQGGSCQLRSLPGKGTTATLTLPV